MGRHFCDGVAEPAGELVPVPIVAETQVEPGDCLVGEPVIPGSRLHGLRFAARSAVSRRSVVVALLWRSYSCFANPGDFNYGNQYLYNIKEMLDVLDRS